MAKRRATHNDGDGEDFAEGSQASKRARQSESDNEVRAHSRTQRDVKGKGKAKAQDDELDIGPVEQVEEIVPDADEEKRFEEEHEDQIRAKVLGKKQTQGGIAEMGIIESLEMHQFMCHKYLTFKFGPQINFIIGHNGSGKSAVLSALTVALGGKANTTGRGSGLKSFIKEGESAAEVTVVIKNKGEEAYRHKDYGDSIVITRRFTREGSSSYKIKSRDGKLVSSKREELSAICDHMNIQVDNPMNILTQDSARQFLSASQPGDKYKFFLRGTQLSQLSEEYSTCMENITQTQKVLLHKLEAIPDLEDALQEASARFEEARKAREQRHKADELKKELAWAHVATKQEEYEAKCRERAKLTRKLEKIEKSIEEAQAQVGKAEAVVSAHEEDMNCLGDIEELTKRLNAIKIEMRNNRTELTNLKGVEKDMNDNVTKNNALINGLKTAIQTEQERNESLTKGKRDETLKKLNDAQVAHRDADAKYKELVAKRPQLEVEVQRAGAHGKELSAEQARVKDQIVAVGGQLDLCDRREQSKLAMFGRNLEAVIKEIQGTQWRGQPPVGPFGIHVKVKDARWAPLFRIQLGNAMSSWAVTNPVDRQTLSRILKKYGNDPGIYITDVDLFDYSGGEPPQELLTVLRALEISDPFVLRILINSARIESTILANSRAEAESLLHKYKLAGNAWAADLYTVQRYRDGGIRSTTIRSLNNGDSRQQMFSSSNVEADRQKFRAEKAEFEQRYKQLGAEIQTAHQVYQEANVNLNNLKREIDGAGRAARSAREVRDRLQDEVEEEAPVEIQTLINNLKELEAEKENTLRQYQELATKKEAINEAQRPLMQETEQLREQINAFEGKRARLEALIIEAVDVRMKAQNDKAHFDKKLAEEKEVINACQLTVDQLKEEFTQWTQKAEQYCARVENPRKVVDIQRNLDSVQSALKEREKRDGATVEEMTIEVNKKKAALDNAKKELKNMVTLNKALKRSIKVRLRRWHEFRRHIALRCKIYFGYHLSQRGYYGKVLFDHVAGHLQLKVQTDDMVPTQGGSREKDPRSLSGGEKSFSTICLLLSLWESIGCPIRCLDEFDVFMDAVNRRISMRMMIDTANASDRKQYILITPQDMSNIHIGPTVRVLRMSDPERGQGLLRFQ